MSEEIRCRIINSWLYRSIERKVNDFLELNRDIEIIRIEYADAGLFGCSVMIIYKHK